MAKTLVEQYVEDPDHMRLFQQERAIYRVTELLESIMKETGVTRSELAKRLGRTKGWVTQLLDGQANKTVRTIADVLAVLGRECKVSAPKISIGGRVIPASETRFSKDRSGEHVRQQMQVILKIGPAGQQYTSVFERTSSTEEERIAF